MDQAVTGNVCVMTSGGVSTRGAKGTGMVRNTCAAAVTCVLVAAAADDDDDSLGAEETFDREIVLAFFWGRWGTSSGALCRLLITIGGGA